MNILMKTGKKFGLSVYADDMFDFTMISTVTIIRIINPNNLMTLSV